MTLTGRGLRFPDPELIPHVGLTAKQIDPQSRICCKDSLENTQKMVERVGIKDLEKG
jgi:hypothetical protein